MGDLLSTPSFMNKIVNTIVLLLIAVYTVAFLQISNSNKKGLGPIILSLFVILIVLLSIVTVLRLSVEVQISSKKLTSKKGARYIEKFLHKLLNKEKGVIKQIYKDEECRICLSKQFDDPDQIYLPLCNPEHVTCEECFSKLSSRCPFCRSHPCRFVHIGFTPKVHLGK